MSGSAELCYLSIDEAGARLRGGELSPVELTRAYLDRIEALDHRLHSYLHVAREGALERARSAERELGRGEWRGPLHGIPVALKDIFDTAGVPTTGGSRIYRDRVPERNATVSARLEAAGAVLLGKLTMSELAMTGPPGFGEEARNPWNLDCAPGWSSSGSGVAVAAGLCAGACGSDSGGSIRFPASYNNIVGLMPTYGRVSRYGVIPLTWSIDHLGPMTRCVEDAALMLGVIAGHDPRDRTSSRASVPDYRAALQDIETLMTARPDSPEGEKLDVLATLVEAYERKHYPLELPDPVAAIKFEMEQKGLTAKDLVPMIGRKNRVYEVLNRKRSLTLKMIWRLHEQLGMPAESLIKQTPRKFGTPIN